MSKIIQKFNELFSIEEFISLDGSRTETRYFQKFRKEPKWYRDELENNNKK